MTRPKAAAARPPGVRPFWLKIHRWLGLALALFLISAGLTGSVLAFHDTLDAQLNPRLFHVEPRGQRLSPLQLRLIGERLVPQARIDSARLDRGPEESAMMSLDPRIDPSSGKPYVLSGNQLFVNPYTGAMLGMRDSEKLGLDREHLMETLFSLHRHLLLGDAGTKILACVALAWFISTFIGFYLTLPARSRRFFAGWKPAWKLKWGAPLARFSFDLHRVTGLWLWLLLFTMSFGAVRVTLGDLGVFDPMLGRLTPMVDSGAAIARSAIKIDEPRLTWDNALVLSRKLMEGVAQREGFKIVREARLSLNRDLGMYVYTVHSPLDVFDSGDTDLYVSAVDGREIAFVQPQMSWGNSFSNWLWAIHRARVGSTLWKTLVSMTGLATATLAVTGFIVWWKRRRPARPV